MSTEKQEASIPAQRTEVEAYAAKHGYQIIREYKDEGISGDATEKRIAFQKMLADAKQLGDFGLVLCWDQDRFGRFDPLEAGYWIKPLRDAGVRLETVAQGRIDWEDFAGRIVYAVQQEGKHAYLRDLSRNVTRSMAAKARACGWNGGKAPYGYNLVEGRLAPGDPAEVEIVRWLYHTYARTDTSLRALLLSLNGRGVPSPRGKQWHVSVIRSILSAPWYKGAYAWNRRHLGKYHGVQEGEVRARKLRGKTLYHNPRQDWFVAAGYVEQPLVAPDIWEAVQQKLAARRTKRTPHVGGGRFLLTKLVYCGHCGKPMYNRENVNSKGKKFPALLCSTYHMLGTCGSYRTAQQPLVRVVARKIQERFTDADNVRLLREEIRRQLEARRQGNPGRKTALQKELKELTAKIERGVENLLAAPADLRGCLTEALRKLQAREAELKGELATLAQSGPSEEDLLAQVDRAVAQLGRLPEALEKAQPALARAVLQQTVSRVECWFDRVPYGERKGGKKLWTTPIVRGLIHVRPDAVLKDVLIGGPKRMPTGPIKW
jgi:DNA invertase Pin-like site-specific DNA recombinase